MSRGESIFGKSMSLEVLHDLRGVARVSLIDHRAVDNLPVELERDA